MSRHMARGRVAAFVRAWRSKGYSASVWSDDGVDLLIADLEALARPRQVVRTIAQLQALAPGTIIAVQGGRAAQVEAAEQYDGDTWEAIEAKRLLYVGTDLYDYLLPDPSAEELDTLRRMLPAIVIDTKEDHA